MTTHYDIVIAGAGPAGLHAAQAAAAGGARIAILDDNPSAGGQVWRQGPSHPVSAPLRALLDELRARDNVDWWPGARIVAALAPRRVLVESAARGSVWLDWSRLVIATGARERMLPFAGWTLPGVTGAGGLQALIKGGVPVRGERIVIAGSGPLLIAALATARDAGACVVAVVEQASAAAVMRFGAGLAATPSKLVQAASLTRGFAGTRYLTGSVVVEARGAGRVETATIRRADGTTITLDCERIACGYGLVPNLTLAHALGCALRDDAIAVDGAQRTSISDVFAAGESTGVGGMELAAVEGRIAGLVASGHAGEVDATLAKRRAHWRRFAARVDHAFALGDAARALPPPDTLMCRCEDVSVGDVSAHATWRDAKLHTRCGMGACQGRICGTAAATWFGWRPWDAATPRPPFSPTSIATLIAACDGDADAAPQALHEGSEPRS
ncbi:NAD(P)/FAD-dependent oxidoreductase [Paraburkholderia phosphatilytica]|uniref:NAD(P)/FAD-dependent oxidoreductase n=1 Tax=Paraburkholderia phosphatilytica TaxID=2282883 RepID=UPI000E4EA2E7|nr:FAD/NAD(P)-binding oxidoreductase [Paraburkholderia phosphatilytica]